MADLATILKGGPGIVFTDDGTNITCTFNGVPYGYLSVKDYGAVGDGVTDDTAAFNAMVAAAKTLGTKAAMLVPVGVYIISAPIILYSGMRLIGAGSSPEGYASSVLKLADGANCNLIQSYTWTSRDEWLHWTEIAHLYLIGNKANNASGSGIAIFQPGEVSDIHDCMVERFAEYGYRLEGNSAPCRLHEVNGSENGIAEFYFNETGAAVTTLDGPSGDAEDGDTCYIKISGHCTITIRDLKAEFNHTPVILTETSDPSDGSSITLIGGYANSQSTKASFLKSIKGQPNVVMIGTRMNNYTNVIEDVGNSKTIPIENAFVGLLTYGRPILAYDWLSRRGMDMLYGMSIGTQDSSANKFRLISNDDDGVTIRGVGQTGAISLAENGAGAHLVGKAQQTWTPRLRVGGANFDASTTHIYSGSGTPEGVVTAAVGSLYLRSDGAASTTLYIKEAGTGNTGWAAK